jgi:hypothetical protein
MICSYECTFCEACALSALCNVCPNCGGNFQHRPIRPRAMLAKHPAGVQRHALDTPLRVLLFRADLAGAVEAADLTRCRPQQADVLAVIAATTTGRQMQTDGNPFAGRQRPVKRVR